MLKIMLLSVLFISPVLACSVHVVTQPEKVASCEAINTLAPVGCPEASKGDCSGCLHEITSSAQSMGADTILIASKDTKLCAKQEITATLFKCPKGE